MNAVKHLITEEDGAQVIEYSMIIAVASLALALSMTSLQPPLCTFAAQVSNFLGAPAPAQACVTAGPGAPRGDGGTGTGNGNGQGNGNGKGNGDSKGNGAGVR